MKKQCQKCSTIFDADFEWKTHCKRCFAKMKQAERDAAPSVEPEVRIVTVKVAIPDDMLMRLIRLCHPDRHNNSETSNIATKWLLATREDQRGATA